ncbi:MAG: outer rane assembly lipoprotein YfiO [Acidobacteriaceae bacterium]|nr:outer rane assembly lipoprotein YfiO [Acidobacteriaceae bacterium]
MNERSFFPSLKSGRRAGVSVAALLMASLLTVGLSVGAAAQVTGASQTSTDPATGRPQETVTLSASPGKKTRKEKEEKVVQSKDTKRELKKTRKAEPLIGVDSKLPDKQLYDKATEQTKKGHYDVARLDLQTLLNTYPDSQYQMRAKLAIADSWYKEGGTAALTQAEAEYADFRVFFPNAPEAAEAQMRIGDIYFRQMDKPDRDYAKAVHAQEEYRRMLTDYPESTLVPDAKQRLREVQEVLAVRESEIAAFYSTHANWPATIARYQTVVDSYPQYSHMDDVLVGLGDAYEAEARYVRTLKLPEAGKARLEKTYDDQAIAAYRRVVTEHAASSHVEDARDRLAAMNIPMPAPTPEQMAESAALENSRRSYRLQDRLSLLILHRPDTVLAATKGEPTLSDPKPTLAPTVYKQILADFNGALNPNAVQPAAAAAPAADGTPAAATDAAAGPAAPLQLNEVPAAGAGDSGNGASTMTAAPAAPSGARGNSVGVEILTPGVNGSSAAPAAAATPDAGGLKAVGPMNSAPLPAVEKVGAAPDAVNDIPAGAAPAGQTPAANGKNKKPEFDKGEESSSKHKKKKGLNKINPF